MIEIDWAWVIEVWLVFGGVVVIVALVAGVSEFISGLFR